MCYLQLFAFTNENVDFSFFFFNFEMFSDFTESMTKRKKRCTSRQQQLESDGRAAGCAHSVTTQD